MTETIGAATLVRIENLERTATKQVATMSMMAHQLQALYVVNAAFAGIQCHQEGFDFEVLRRKVLEVFTNRERDAEAIAYVEALLGHVGTVPATRDE